MSSLAVVVFKDGKVQPNAQVSLIGPSGPITKNTNGSGAVNFMGLKPGKYNVDARHSGVCLGAGYWDLKEGEGGVIHLKYPQTPIDQGQDDEKKGTLTVSVAWIGSHRWNPDMATYQLVNCAEVRLAGPTFKSRLTKAGIAKFSGLEPGEYSISASAVAVIAVLASGQTSKRVQAGPWNSAWVFLDVPQLPEKPPFEGYLTQAEIKGQISRLEAELIYWRLRISENERLIPELKYSCRTDPETDPERKMEKCERLYVKWTDLEQQNSSIQALFVRPKEKQLAQLKIALRWPWATRRPTEWDL